MGDGYLEATNEHVELSAFINPVDHLFYGVICDTRRRGTMYTDMRNVLFRAVDIGFADVSDPVRHGYVAAGHINRLRVAKATLCAVEL